MLLTSRNRQKYFYQCGARFSFTIKSCGRKSSHLERRLRELQTLVDMLFTLTDFISSHCFALWQNLLNIRLKIPCIFLLKGIGTDYIQLVSNTIQNFHMQIQNINKILQNWVIHLSKLKMCIKHGGSDSTVIKRRQQQLGRMADFLPSVTFSVLDL